MLAASAATLAAQTVEGEFERTLAVGGDTLALNIGTGSGRIAVTIGEPGVARIVGHIRGYADRWTPDAPDVVADRVRTIETNPPIVLDGDVLRVGYLDGSLHRQVGISYEMVVPANTRVRARTGSGDVRVDGVTGAVEARTGSGSMELLEPRLAWRLVTAGVALAGRGRSGATALRVSAGAPGTK